MNYDCSRSGIQSLPVKCPYLTCPKAYQVKKFGECCATCSPECKYNVESSDEDKTACSFKEKIHFMHAPGIYREFFLKMTDFG